MFRNLNLIMILLITSSFGNQINQNNKYKDDYINLVKKSCSQADILDFEYRADYVEIEYLCDNIYYEVGISDNKILFKESKADESEIPVEKINRKLEKKYAGWILDEISLVELADTSFLKVEIVKDGLEQNLYFTLEGKWYKANSIVVSNKWNVKNLSKSSLYRDSEYNFLKPNKIYDLPEILKEISGISILDSTKILCVQDELGIVFEYDLAGETLTKVNRFTDIGDFEDITISGDNVFALRSDGNIFYFDYKKKGKIYQKMLSINAMNFESLFYNNSDGYFYFASKDALLNQKESKRYIFSFKFNESNNPKVYLESNIIDIKNILSKELKTLGSDDIIFNPSAIAIHPLTNDFYVLSANDRLIAIYDKNGLKNVYPLPAEIYYKPEGIAFYPNGDLLISSEGDKRGLVKANIFLMKYLR